MGSLCSRRLNDEGTKSSAKKDQAEAKGESAKNEENANTKEKDWRLTPDEERELKALFEEYDVTRDGRMGKNEFFAFCNQLPKKCAWVAHALSLKGSNSAVKSDELFSCIDMDSDGSLKFEELRVYIARAKSKASSSRKRPAPDSTGEYESSPKKSKRLSLAQEQDLERVFQEIDVDESGDFSKNEFMVFCLKVPKLAAWVAKALGVPGIKADVLFSQIDTDGNAKISKKELRAYILKNLSQA